MKKLWISLKRDKVYAEVYYKGEMICIVKVNDSNRSVNAVISLYANSDTVFKIIRDDKIEQVVDDNFFNKESFNR
jgi:hypothetical protein